MKSNVRRLVAACALLALGAIVALAVGCGGEQKKAEPTVVKIQGTVRHVKIKHKAQPDDFDFDVPNDKFVTINSASAVFWHFKVCEKYADSAVIQFDPSHNPPSPFATGSHFIFTADDMGIVGDNVNVNPPKPDTFFYSLTVYRDHGHKPPVVLDPGIIIDSGKDADTTRSGP